ncbi:MAG: DNA-(Apurinic or apyrimidinic site) lyase / endonuclease III [Parcubacteria group bacterium GW2011_GWD2_42_14]|nr:MAG: DNA-(Apurinic or apyrimidinic site) lyase / endonuclease III [Parcubacteria group bacterium GW2011_GWD2_42_14]
MTQKKQVTRRLQQPHKSIPQNSVLFRERKARLLKLNTKLKKLFPKAEIALTWNTHWELLVAVELSAQCTDKKVNEVTEVLFKKYPTLDAYVNAKQKDFEQDIKPTGFYKNKAKNVLAAAKRVTEVYGGQIPKTMEEILTIPGVARKTANVVLGNAHGVVDGIAVDTHVRRFALRYNLTDSKDPVKIEQDLMLLLPKKEWFAFTYRVIEYGRQIAPARVYDTSKDPLIPIYPPAGQMFRV